MLSNIPYTYEDIECHTSGLYELQSDLAELNLGDKTNVRWGGHYAGEVLAKILMMLSATKYDERTHIITYYGSNSYRFLRTIEQFNNNECYGLVINQEAQTHFNVANYPTAQFLQNAQEYLKQSSQHFLRIFTIEGQQALYVWTNKNISPENLYKLLALLERLYPLKNEVYNNFINACIKKDIEAANKVIEDYMNSDEINKRRYEEFKAGFKSNRETQIKSLEADINHSRNRINEYESSIASLATRIRTSTENIAFLRSSDNGEDIELLFKYLKKSPYINKFIMYASGTLELYYHAPIVYFNDYPAEKMIAQDWRTERQKNILKIIIGRKYTLWTKAKLQFETGNFAVNLDRVENNFPLLPHPHINEYRCFGNHLGAIREAAETGNHLGAIEQITQAVLNLNFYDGCVIDHMLRLLVNQYNSLPCWKCEETGEMLTTEKVVERGDYYEKTQSND